MFEKFDQLGQLLEVVVLLFELFGLLLVAVLEAVELDLELLVLSINLLYFSLDLSNLLA